MSTTTSYIYVSSVIYDDVYEQYDMLNHLNYENERLFQQIDEYCHDLLKEHILDGQFCGVWFDDDQLFVVDMDDNEYLLTKSPN